MKRGKGKKAQVTIFVIIAIILITGLLIFLIARGTIRLPGSNRVDKEVRAIDSLIESCIEQRAIDAIGLVGLQGGYITLPEEFLETAISNIAYGVYNGKKTLPNKSEIEEEIADYIKTSIVFCFDESDSEFNITQEEAEADVKIKDNSIKISTRLPISATRGENTFTINREYENEIHIRFGKIYDVANKIAEKAIKTPESIDLTYLTTLEFDAIFIPVDSETIIYTITDKNLENINNSYTFVYAHKLNEE